jgi:hypothetical protein
MARVGGREGLGTISTAVWEGGLLNVGDIRVKVALGTVSRAGVMGIWENGPVGGEGMCGYYKLGTFRLSIWEYVPNSDLPPTRDILPNHPPTRHGI